MEQMHFNLTKILPSNPDIHFCANYLDMTTVI